MFVHPKCEIIFSFSSNYLYFNYFNINIRLSSIAPHIFIAVPILREKKSLLSSLRAKRSLTMALAIVGIAITLYTGSNHVKKERNDLAKDLNFTGNNGICTYKSFSTKIISDPYYNVH